MTIEPKYNPGEYVWVMYNNKPEKVIITQRVIISEISMNDRPIVIYNSVYYYLYKLGKYTEEQIFKTKEDLIKSL